MGENVPVLRFPEFIGQWVYKKLGDVCVKVQDGTHFSPKIIDDGKFKYITSKNIKNGFLLLDDVELISEEDHKKIYKRCDVRYGDILITKDGASTGNVCLNILTEEFSLLSSVAFLRADQSKALNSYIYQYVSSPCGQKQILLAIAGQAITRITLSKIKNFSFVFPNLYEQQKIANFLTSIDNRIQQLTRKKALLEQYKKGMMQKLFSQEIRFKDDQGKDYPDWKEKRLGDILNYEQPTKYLVDDSEYDDSYDIPVLTAGKTFLLGFTNEKHGIFQEKLPTIIFDDFTTAFQYVDFPFKVKSSAMKILVPKNEKINVRYVYEAMKRIVFPLGEHKRYWISEYQKEKISYPSDDEIAKIALFLASVDQKTDVVTHELEKMQRFKKGLLQQMFV